MDSVQEFYAAASAFITGGTGFLGKVLVEKLLRSCLDLDRIYILIRPKKAISADERLNSLRNDKIFNRIRSECPKVLSKLRVVSGDMKSPRLGLSEQDEQLLVEQVSIVFHVAATVRFNEGMKEAADQNTVGTLKVLDLCSRMELLKSVVHVSTAYINPSSNVIEEKVYNTSEQVTKDEFLKLVEILPRPLMNNMELNLMGGISEHIHIYKGNG